MKFPQNHSFAGIVSVLFLLVVSTFACAGGSVRYEAEDGVVTGLYIDNALPGFSGSGYVTCFENPGDEVRITINPPAAGFYTLRIAYAADNPKFNPVLINDSIQGNRLFQKTNGFTEMEFGRIRLNAGANTVRIGSDWGQIAVDYIRIEPAPPTQSFHLSNRLVSPGASPEARKLFETLKGVFGKKILAGQQDSAQGKRLAFIAEQTGGKAPAILGLDLLNYSGAYDKPDGQIEMAKEWVLNRHGIVTFSWHWFSPFGAIGPVWSSFSTNKTTFDASRIADENSAEYRAIIRDIDLVASSLKVLRDAHIPVLWRPLHEAEGKWFWWGAKGPAVTRQLYRLMFDRFTRIHGLNNLIWVWTTTDNPDALEWYPGDDVVDIVGADLYPPKGERGTFLSVFNNIQQIYEGRKPVALCETGALVNPDDLKRDGADWLWFSVWDDFISRSDANPPSLIDRTYHHDRVITLDTLSAAPPENAGPVRLYGVLEQTPDHAAGERAIGLRVAVIPVIWERFEPRRGVFDPAYIRELNQKKESLRKLGYQLQLDPGVQYPPAWIFSLPDARYRNQFGELFKTDEPGASLPNVVFNAEIRKEIGRYFSELFMQLGTDWDYVRLGCGKFGELNYPASKSGPNSNCYWAFDDLAQGKKTGLPDGISSCPVTGWIPGISSPEHESARKFIEWYLDALKNYQAWQIATVRRDYAGDICLLYGSWGVRPGWIASAVKKDLAGFTGPEKNGEIQQGFDWARMIGDIKDSKVIVYCTWVDGTLSNRDLADDESADPARWSPVHWQASLAQAHPLKLRIWGENTGSNDRKAMQLAFERMKRFGLMGLLWAFERDLFATPNSRGFATFDDYAEMIRNNP